MASRVVQRGTNGDEARHGESEGDTEGQAGEDEKLLRIKS